MNKYTMSTNPRSFHMTAATKAMVIKKNIAVLYDESEQLDKWEAVTSTTKPAKVKRILEAATTERLVEIYETLSHLMYDNQDPISKEQSIARWWVERELSDRDYGFYCLWIDEEPGVSPRKYFLDYWMFEEIW